MISRSEPQDKVVQSALWFAAQNIEIAPAFGIDADGCCGCRNRSCRMMGKHPMLQEEHTKGSSNPNEIRLWWRRRPSANLLVHTGRRNRLVVVDVDVRDGGLTNFARLLDRAPELLSGLTVRTGSGGLHVYFRSSESWPSGLDVVAPGIDLRGDGGFVIGPHSRHASGGIYSVEHPEGCSQIADLPASVATVLLEVVRSKASIS